MAKLKKQLQNKQKNKKYKTLIKNQIKAFNQSLKQDDSGNNELVSALTSKVQRLLDKATNKKIIKKNKANRLKRKVQQNAYKKTKLVM